MYLPDSGQTLKTEVDLINLLAHIEAASPADTLRARRGDVARYVQASYDALLQTENANGLSLVERRLAALRVAVLTENGELADYYRDQLLGLGQAPEVIEAVTHFPDGRGLSARESAILRHTDLLTVEPSAANRNHVAALQSAGLSVRDIVTLAQLVAFLSFQVRLLVVARNYAVIL